VPDEAKISARVAAQFARENSYEHVEHVALDSAVVARSAIIIRDGIGPKVETARRKLAAIAREYGAELIERDFPNGSRVGLKFVGGRFVNGIGAILYLA
jgi:hypothetical protein